MPTPKKRPALFLDRDGVINREVHYLHRQQDVVLLEGAAEAIAELNRRGVPVVLVTNQAGIARGIFSESDFWKVQDRLAAMLREQNAHLDGVYFCPHHPEHGVGSYRVDCRCRKPNPGMLLEAARALHLDLRRSVLVGDKISDLEAALAAGCRPILVRTGYGRESERALATHERLRKVEIFADLSAAVRALADSLEVTHER